MGPTRRSTRNPTTYFRRAPYNLRSRSRVRYNYYDTIAAGDGNNTAAETETKPEPLPKVRQFFPSSQLELTYSARHSLCVIRL